MYWIVQNNMPIFGRGFADERNEITLLSVSSGLVKIIWARLKPTKSKMIFFLSHRLLIEQQEKKWSALKIWSLFCIVQSRKTKQSPRLLSLLTLFMQTTEQIVFPHFERIAVCLLVFLSLNVWKWPNSECSLAPSPCWSVECCIKC